MRLFVAGIAAAGLLAGCSQKNDDVMLNEVVRLQTENANLQQQLAAKSEPEPQQPTFDLVVNWPDGRAPDHTNFGSEAACDKALAVIKADSQAQIDEANSHVGEVLPGGARLVVAGRPKLPTAYCLPLS